MDNTQTAKGGSPSSPESQSPNSMSAHLQSRRPPNIFISCSNTSEVAVPVADAAPQSQRSTIVEAPHRMDEPRGGRLTPPPGSQQQHRPVLSNESLCSVESAPSTTDGGSGPPVPPVIVHSATKTLPFMDFELATNPAAQTAHHPVILPPSSAGLVKRSGNIAEDTAVVVVRGFGGGASTSSGLSVHRPPPHPHNHHHHHHHHHQSQPSSQPPQPGASTPFDGEEHHVSKNIPHDVLLRNLTLFVLLKVLGSFDSGAFSATLNGDNGITEDWGLSVAQQGTLSSSVFLGNMIGCAIAGHLFTIYSAKLLLLVSLMIHGFFTFLFASAETYEFALLCRFFIGVTLAFIVVYTPVWVDEFAPKSSAATWMALQNAGVPLGIMIGFVVGGLMPTYTSVSWEWSFYFKSIVMVPIVAIVAKTERKTLDSSSQAAASLEFRQHLQRRSTTTAGALTSTAAAAAGGEHDEGANIVEAAEGEAAVAGGGDHHPVASPCSALDAAIRESSRRLQYITMRLLRNGVFITNMLSLSSLYFVVSGLQTFITSYLRAEPFNASMETIVIGFGCAVVTAPVFGVVAGGVLLDKIGGYHGNLVRASRFGLAWGVAAACVGVVCIFIRSTTLFLVVVWVLLFCGGAIIPPGSGINMASLPVHLRPSGSSVAQMSFNLLGNFSGPLVCGWIAEWSGSLTWGIRAVLSMGVLGVIPMALCSWLAQRRANKQALLEHAAARCAVIDTEDDGQDGHHQSHHNNSDYQAMSRPDERGDAPGSASSSNEDSSQRAMMVAEQQHARSGNHQAGNHHHCCYASNMSIIAALEEVVEANHCESPRHTDEESELMEIVRNGTSASRPLGKDAGSITQCTLASHERVTPGPSFHCHITPAGTPQRGRGLSGTGASSCSPHAAPHGTPSGNRNSSKDASSSICERPLPPPGTPQQLNASRTHLHSARGRSASLSHQPTPLSGIIQMLNAVPDFGEHLEDDEGYFGGTSPAADAASAVDDRSIALDSAQFNLSFPYQHSFGMDVVRGILNLESPQPSRGDTRAHTYHHAVSSPSPAGASSSYNGAVHPGESPPLVDGAVHSFLMQPPHQPSEEFAV